MLSQFYIFALSAFVAQIVSSNNLEQGHDTKVVCPCSSASLCNPITAPDRQEVVGFAPDLTYYKKFDWTKLTTIVVQESVIAQTGVEFVCHAHQYGTRVLVWTAISRDELSNATARMANVQHYLKLTQKYYMDGANIDVEILTPEPSVSEGLTDYVRETNRVHKAANPHSLVVTDVPWLPDIYQGHNTWGLANNSDFLFIMAYDEISTTFPCIAMANSPLHRTEVGAKLFKYIGIPGNKLVLGLAWYGYRHNCSIFLGGWCISKSHKRSCKRMSLAYGTVSQLLPHSMGGQQWSNWYASPYMNYQMPWGVQQIWYDDARSLKLKYGLAEELNFRGVGIFSVNDLNYANASDPTTSEMWDALPQYK